MKTMPLKARPVRSLLQNEEAFWQATLHRDAHADGSFVFAVRSTRIYCRPSCPARRPLRRNTLFFRTTAEAENHGYRPCRRCRPQEQDRSASLIQRAAALLAESHEEALRLGPLAARLQTSPARLRRTFRRMTGLSPREFGQSLRLNHFKKMLREGHGIADALYACGYGSPSRIMKKLTRIWV